MHTTPNDAPALTGDPMPYAGRPYERRLSDSGRKIVSLDLDATLVSEIDRLSSAQRNRRGLTIDALLRIALSSPEVAAMR